MSTATMTTSERRTPERVEALAAAAAGGCRDSLADLYDLYVDVTYRYVLVRCGGLKHLAEDITSETWVRIATSIGSYETGRSCFIAWAQKIARNALNDHYRRSSRRPELPTGLMLAGAAETDPACEAPSPEAAAVATDEREHLAEALRALPQHHALVLVLRFYEGMSVGEVAAVLGIKENAVKQRQYRAVKAIGESVRLRLSDDSTAPIRTTSRPSTRTNQEA